MNAPLPTPKDLEKLPLRAVVAYAARTARRLSSELRGIVADEILDNALQLVEAVLTANDIRAVDPASVMRASARVTAAYEGAPADMKSLAKFRMVFSLVHATLAAMFAILAAEAPSRARHQMKLAADDAQRAVRQIEALGTIAAAAATQAARHDYETLLREYGQHDEVVVGEPVHCFDR